MSFWNKMRSYAAPATTSTVSSQRLTPTFEDEGIVYAPVRDADLLNTVGSQRLALAYLRQLEEEGYITRLVEDWLLPWEQVYYLMRSPEHRDSLALLALPTLTGIRPRLTSSGSLSDEGFKVLLQGWLDEHGTPLSGPFSRQGAVCTLHNQQFLIPEAVWKLLLSVQKLSRTQKEAPGEKTNQLGWATIRKYAKAANAQMDGFLDRTVVVRPETLKFQLNKQLIGGEQVIEVIPQFEEQPDGWLDSFDRQKFVMDRYVIPSADGGITHVLISPEVKNVLDEVRAMPGRRVSGEKASLFLRNPYAFLGPEAANILDPDAYDHSLEMAGIYFYQFVINPHFTPDGKFDTITLILTAPAEGPAPVQLDIDSPTSLEQFIKEVATNFLAELPCACWKGYELDLSGFSQRDLTGLEDLQQRWAQEVAGKELDDLFDLSQYGARVIGIGPAEKFVSPYLQKTSSENWLPADLLNEIGMDGALLSKWETSNHEHYEEFKNNIATAIQNREANVRMPGAELDVELLTAQRIATAWGERFKQVDNSSPPSEKDRQVLQVAGNIEEVDFGLTRGEMIRLGHTANPDLPEALLPSTTLRDHQLKGVAWLQHLFSLSPGVTSGCVLADDMGLGKTIQLLTFIAWCIENDPDGPPVLIVAPVSLLDNWEAEMRAFMHETMANEALKLYGHALTQARTHRDDIPAPIRAHGIQNLLRFGWRQNKRIVLTTYETLRDQEFSLARQEWSVVICDEAQKIKNPAARVTQAMRALKGRFRIACTGTPVENSLTDLWCLYDWVQPGLLGSLNEFGRTFRRPIETKDPQDHAALDELRKLIDPQLLRRTKQEVAKELPAKIEDAACKSIKMSQLQDRLYRSEIVRYHDKRVLQEQLGQQSAAMLGLLHTLKMICAHPQAVRPEGQPLDVSPKLRWTMEKLRAIQGRDEKVIIFTELRDIQRALQLTILDEFGFRPEVINGDTNASGERGPTRQKLINRFQEQPGFGVIILSTTAVGFGVNVQAANHVIHFTRPWNPAKEDQATDRAYRIGQKRDVYVYYPTVISDGITTFEQTLDQLLMRKRSLATDMLNGSGDIEISEFTADFEHITEG